VLSEVLSGLPRAADPNLLVGFETADDAAVYRLSPEIAVISTVDYITPVVDDPLWFGRIAAANSLSDVWAMGGRPIMALNLVNFPAKSLDLGLLRDMLRGGAEKVVEAGACLAGGNRFLGDLSGCNGKVGAHAGDVNRSCHCATDDHFFGHNFLLLG